MIMEYASSAEATRPETRHRNLSVADWLGIHNRRIQAVEARNGDDMVHKFPCPVCDGTGERHKIVEGVKKRFSCVPCSGTGKWRPYSDMDNFNNIQVAITGAEGNVETVERAEKVGFTDSTHKLHSLLSSLYRPKEPSYDKVFLMVRKDNGEQFKIRRDLARYEDTPESIMLELKEYDKELGV